NYFNDKEWIAAGPGGNVYVTWTRFKSNGGQGYVSSNIVEAVSHNNGATWSQPITVSDKSHPFDQGSSVAGAPNGTPYVADEGASPSSGYSQDQTVLARSTDGGQTFTNTELGRVYDDRGCYLPNLAQLRPRLTFERFRLNSFPTLAIDPATGKLAIVWADDRNNPGCAAGAPSFTGSTNNQGILTTSTDGIHW